MSAITSDSLARDWARELERREATRASVPLSMARKRVASRIGILPGTLENLSRDRLKGVREWVYARLHTALVAELKREIAAHTHELEKLERLGRIPGDGTYQEVVAGLEKLRGLLSE